MLKETPAVPCSWIAWAGWKARIPEHWRPLRVENRDATGTFMIGGATQATVQVKWWTPDRERFDGARWLGKRLRSLWKGVVAEPEAPAADRFNQTMWLPKARTRKGAGCSVWYGYSSDAQLLIEVVVNSGAGTEVGQLAETVLLPSLDVSHRKAPMRWAVYDTSFESPPGYVIHESRLNLGAISLILKQGKHQLMLCQVYPGGSALGKASLAEWLDTTALRGKRKSNPIDGAKEIQIDSFKGLKRASTEHLPFPLAQIEPRHCVAMIVHDERLDRLLIVEHISPVWTEDVLVSDAIRGMNWTLEDRRSHETNRAAHEPS